VSELAAGIALHGLRLAVTSKVVRAAALVAGRLAGAADKASPCLAEAAAADGSAPVEAGNRGVGAGALEKKKSAYVGGFSLSRTGGGGTHSQVANRVAVVAPVVSGCAAAQTQGRALGLDVAETLAVVALLRLGGARHGALVRLMVGLLACSPMSATVPGRVLWANCGEGVRTVVAEAVRRDTLVGLVAELTALVARATGGRHC
jgi:hypothetical protein